MSPLGVSVVAKQSALTLVTTVELLADPLAPEVQEVYAAAQTEFAYVGPLLDKAGAKRAAGHKFSKASEPEPKVSEPAEPADPAQPADPLTLLVRAHEAGRQVVFASMGTVITGDSPEIGWRHNMPPGRSSVSLHSAVEVVKPERSTHGNTFAEPRSVDGVPQGLTGKELCQAAWRGLFDAFGADSADEGPLLLVSLGPQADALENLSPPANAVCLPVMPQVDILKAGVDLFLTPLVQDLNSQTSREMRF